MKNFVLIVILMLFAQILKAQQSQKFTAVESEVVAVIQKMFDGMRKGDSAMVSATFHSTMRLQTTFTNKAGQATLVTENSPANFLKAVGTPHPEVYDERILNYEVRVDDNLATVWTPYEFYAGEKFSHCGVNAFQLFKSDKGWKIIHIVDTRRKEGCKGK